MKKVLLILAILIILLILGVFIKINIYKKTIDKQTITISSLWEKNGKPVDVFVVEKINFKLFRKLSGVLINNKIISQVSYNDSLFLSPGMNFYIDKTKAGKLIEVSDTPIPETGLYKVVLKLNNKYNIDQINENFLNLYINHKTYKNSLYIPDKAIIKKRDNDKTYVWKLIKDNENYIAKLINIKISHTNDFNQVLVRKGINVNDLIIVSGHEVLESGDKVRIHKGDKD